MGKTAKTICKYFEYIIFLVFTDGHRYFSGLYSFDIFPSNQHVQNSAVEN
jgi:hypothetical protein